MAKYNSEVLGGYIERYDVFRDSRIGSLRLFDLNFTRVFKGYFFLKNDDFSKIFNFATYPGAMADLHFILN